MKITQVGKTKTPRGGYQQKILSVQGLMMKWFLWSANQLIYDINTNLNHKKIKLYNIYKISSYQWIGSWACNIGNRK